MSKSYSIREAKPHDAGDILRLIKELAEYENMPDGVKICEKEIADNLSTWYKCILLLYKPADDEKTEVIGYAIWNYCFSTWRGRMAYLEDIYVSQAHRGKGLGYSLIQCVAKISHEKGCDRLRFAVLGWNKLAKRMYEKIKAVNLTETEEWELMHIQGEDLTQLAMQTPKISLSS